MKADELISAKRPREDGGEAEAFVAGGMQLLSLGGPTEQSHHPSPAETAAEQTPATPKDSSNKLIDRTKELLRVASESKQLIALKSKVHQGMSLHFVPDVPDVPGVPDVPKVFGTLSALRFAPSGEQYSEYSAFQVCSLRRDKDWFSFKVYNEQGLMDLRVDSNSKPTKFTAIFHKDGSLSLHHDTSQRTNLFLGYSSTSEIFSICWPSEDSEACKLVVVPLY
jgi:hypothetical protein